MGRWLTAVVVGSAGGRGGRSLPGGPQSGPQPAGGVPRPCAALPGQGAGVPAADAFSAGQAVLGATSAALRGLGPGGVLDVGGTRLRVAAILPDQLVGAAELVVSRATGAALGVSHDRYLLVRASAGRAFTTSRLHRRLLPLLPASLGIDRDVEVRAPGDSPYLRAGDAVLPPVAVKTLFGEFAARPGPVPGTITVDPVWAAAHLQTTRIPLLGTVTC